MKAIQWVILGLLISICTSCSMLSFLRPQDIKVVEDVADDVLQDELGIDVNPNHGDLKK